MDAAGTNANCSNPATAAVTPHCHIRVDKPNVNSTVKHVFMTAASTGFSGYAIQHGNITLDGVSILWEGFPGAPVQTNNSISSKNVWAELTASGYPAIFSKLNGAAPGLVSFLVTEANTTSIDGEILVVIWDDPTAPQTTVSLMYGAQTTTGDAFAVTLVQPVDKTDPSTVLDMSLGISSASSLPDSTASWNSGSTEPASPRLPEARTTASRQTARSSRWAESAIRTRTRPIPSLPI